jgi:hypothetical protein
MKFLLRSLLVLAVAVAFGAILYVAVQALPSDSPNPPPNANQPGTGRNTPENPAPRPGRSENNRGGGVSWRFLLGLARRVVTFSVLIFVAVLGKNYIFERKPNKKKISD